MPEFILSAILLYRTSLGNRGLLPIVVCTSQTLSAQLSLAIEVDCDDGLCMEPLWFSVTDPENPIGAKP